MTTATYDAAIGRPVAAPRVRRLPLRALAVAGLAVVAIAAGAAWIASPASSVSTDDAYVRADSTIVAPKVQRLIAQILVKDNQAVAAGQTPHRQHSAEYRPAMAAGLDRECPRP